VHSRRPPRGIVFDMDSSVSPTHGEQENSVWNGHYACTCYHPLFVFNQFGDLEGDGGFRAVLLMRRSSVGFPTFAFRERYEQKQYIAGAKWFVLAGFGLGPAAFLERNWKERGTASLSPALFRWET
jgi:Transposase DDE domain group 1